jgi:glycine oxidase
LVVSIIGGGIVGASIAWRLAQRGVQVVIHEAGKLGGEASWAGAGMLAPGGEVASLEGWRGMALASARMYPDFVRELRSESGQGIDYRACGGLELAMGDAEAAELDARAARQAGIGIGSEPARHPSAAHARFYPGDAIVDPRDVMAALRVALSRRGVRIEEGARIADPANLSADVVVVAAGAWSGELGVGPPTEPVRGHLIGFRLPPGTLGPILRHHHTYLLQRSSGFLIAGTSEERVGFQREVDPPTASDIHRRAAGLLPLLGLLQPDDVWTGFRPATASLEPVIGRRGPRTWAAYGHHRNGILLAPATAEAVAGEITASSGMG